MNDTTALFDKPCFWSEIILGECGVQAVLYNHVFCILSTTIGNRQPSKEEFSRIGAVEMIKGTPDFVLETGGNLSVPIEVKM
jgi:hypothetical protein